jgi:hypothetical protein
MTVLEALKELESKGTPAPWTEAMTRSGQDEEDNWFATGPAHNREDYDGNEGDSSIDAELDANIDGFLCRTLRNLAPEIIHFLEVFDQETQGCGNVPNFIPALSMVAFNRLLIQMQSEILGPQKES